MTRRVVILFAAVVAFVPAVARAMPVAPGAAIVSDVVNPFGACFADLPAVQRDLGSVDFPSSEVEAQIAVNPTNPNNLIAVWQQDRWSDGGARGNLAGVSFDGGDTWRVVRPTRSSACTGNLLWVRATDPWVTFSPDGTAYFMHLGIFSLLPTIEETIAADGMVVVRSTDGGLTWGAPSTLVADFSPSIAHDKNTITADPNNSAFVYAVWDAFTKPPSANGNPEASANSRAFGGPAIFTRSTNGGTSWEPIRAIYDPGTRKQTIGNQIVVRPKSVGGELVNVFTVLFESSNEHGLRGRSVAAQISADHGATWSEPEIAARMLGVQTVEPDSGLPVRAAEFLADVAVDPTNGSLYAAWVDARYSNDAYNDVALAMSTDGGRTWTDPVAVPRPLPLDTAPLNRQAFLPQVHVSADGRIAVSYYDFRNNDGADGDLETDHFVSQCRHADLLESDHCAGAWKETRVTAASFDLRRAPISGGRGRFIGDYTGLTDVPGAFATAFSVAGAPDPATVFYSTIPFAD